LPDDTELLPSNPNHETQRGVASTLVHGMAGEPDDEVATDGLANGLSEGVAQLSAGVASMAEAERQGAKGEGMHASDARTGGPNGVEDPSRSLAAAAAAEVVADGIAAAVPAENAEDEGDDAEENAEDGGDDGADDGASVATGASRAHRPAKVGSAEISERVKRQLQKKGNGGGKGSRNEQKDRTKRKTANSVKRELSGASGW